MPPRQPKPAPVLDLPWHQRLARRDWILLIFVELVAVALLATGIKNGDLFGVTAGLAMGLVYAPLRVGGWKLLRPWFSRLRTKDDKRDEAFYRKRK